MIDDEQLKPRKSKLKLPGVVLTPSFNGMTVIEAKNGAEEFLGCTFPWYRVYVYSANGVYTLRLKDEQNNPQSLLIKFKGSGRLIRRLQHRAARAWARESDEPIGFEPKEEPLWGWILLMFIIGGACLYLLIKALAIVPSGIFSPPYTKWTVLAVIGGLAMVVVFSLPMLLFWSLRPRHRDFKSIDLMPTGIVGTTMFGEVISLEFAELAECKLKGRNPLRCRMRTKDGTIYWMALPSPVSIFAYQAIKPSTESRKEINERAIHGFYRQGVRLLLLGLISAILCVVLLNYLASIGVTLPNHVPHLRRLLVGLCFVLPATMGCLMIWSGWSITPKGREIRKKLRTWLSRFKAASP